MLEAEEVKEDNDITESISNTGRSRQRDHGQKNIDHSRGDKTQGTTVEGI